jgi:hypothetical protein
LLLLLLLSPPVDADEVANVLLPLVAVAVVLEALVLLPPDFFHGWNPLPTAASANGGGLLDDNLLHWAASMAKGVPLNPGCSYKIERNNKKIIQSVCFVCLFGWNDKRKERKKKRVFSTGSISSHYLMARVEIAENKRNEEGWWAKEGSLAFLTML